MNYKDAFNILEIDFINTKYEDLTLNYLKKRYRKLALKHHPDKNGNTQESTEHFKKINEAYNYLRREIKNLRPEIEEEEEVIDDTHTIYLNVLKNFIRTVMDGNYIDIVAKIVNDILTKGKKLSIKLFEDLDKDTALNIYIFLSRYKSILYLSDDLLESVKQMVIQKYDNVEIYKLNPSINDLMQNNFYKLYVEEQLYLVPLWHNETYYDGSGCEIIAICEPNLPNNIKIDDDNNLIVEIQLNSHSDLPYMLMNNRPLSFNVGDKIFSIPLSNLYMKIDQYYYFRNEGLVNVKKDIYDLSDKSDIIVRIIFT
jgi:curved DNA-binding protein CbpA